MSKLSTDALRAAIGAIERLENVVRLLLASKPVRDVPETYGEAAWAKKLIDAALRPTPPTTNTHKGPYAVGEPEDGSATVLNSSGESMTADDIVALLNASPQPSSDAVAELANIANARRLDRKAFRDDTEFADWAQSRCRHTLAATLPQPTSKEPK